MLIGSAVATIHKGITQPDTPKVFFSFGYQNEFFDGNSRSATLCIPPFRLIDYLSRHIALHDLLGLFFSSQLVDNKWREIARSDVFAKSRMNKSHSGAMDKMVCFFARPAGCQTEMTGLGNNSFFKKIIGHSEC